LICSKLCGSSYDATLYERCNGNFEVDMQQFIGRLAEKLGVEVLLLHIDEIQARPHAVRALLRAVRDLAPPSQGQVAVSAVLTGISAAFLEEDSDLMAITGYHPREIILGGIHDVDAIRRVLLSDINQSNAELCFNLELLIADLGGVPGYYVRLAQVINSNGLDVSTVSNETVQM
jgi:hypothetical protein